MRAFARFRLPDGEATDLCHGDLIGRLGSAALVIDDPRISEAHAMVSLRRGRLHLLSLRRMVSVRGKPVSELALEEGLDVELADGLVLNVERVSTPAAVMALRSPGIGVRMLAQVASLVDGEPPRLVGRFVPAAAAHLWSVGDGWRLRVANGDPRSVVAGDRFDVGGRDFELCTVALDGAGAGSTEMGGALDPPIRIVTYYDAVEIHLDGRQMVSIGGIGARILSELIAFAGPVEWETAAREVWREEIDTSELRHRWDVALGRLRARLRTGGVRRDMIRCDGTGQLQLALTEHDQIDDRT